MTSRSKKFCIDKLNDIGNKYNNLYYTTIKIKPVDVKSNTYIDYNKDVNDKDPEIKIGDFARTSKYKSILQKVTFQFGQKKVL